MPLHVCSAWSADLGNPQSHTPRCKPHTVPDKSRGHTIEEQTKQLQQLDEHLQDYTAQAHQIDAYAASSSLLVLCTAARSHLFSVLNCHTRTFTALAFSLNPEL